MDNNKLNIKIRRGLLYAGIALIVIGAVLNLFNVSWENVVYTKTDAFQGRTRTANGWTFVLIGELFFSSGSITIKTPPSISGGAAMHSATAVAPPLL